jgi:hypothetical protein
VPPPFVSSLLLILACAGLGGAGLRVACLFARGWVERVVAAFTFACAGAAASALLLGVAGFGTTPGALVGAAVALWLLARFAIPAAQPTLGEQMRGSWARASRGERAAIGAATGALVLWTTWIVRFPHFGFDGVHYHMAEVLLWLRDGHPGAVETVFPGFPVGTYPLVDEVLLAWGTAIGRTQAWALVWTPLLVGVTGLAGWLALRCAGVRASVAALALGGLCLTPIAAFSFNAAHTDVPALAWVVVAGGLTVAARRDQPGLVVAAVVASGLAVGTKTTAAPLAFVIAATAVAAARDHLRAIARPLAAGALAAVGLGGFWYARNLFDHGSPLWPFVHLPGGDPVPVRIPAFRTSFMSHPVATVQLAGHGWATAYFGGSLIVIAAALVSPLLARTRAVAIAAGVTAATLLAWMLAPVSGTATDHPGLATSVDLQYSPRYYLPGLAAATFTVCIAARDARGSRRNVLVTLLASALVVNAWETFKLPGTHVPSPWYPAVGLAIGALLAVAGGRHLTRRTVTLVGAPLGLAAALAVATHGVLARYARQGEDRAVASYLLRHPSHAPIYMAPVMTSVLAGDRVDRKVVALPLDASCASVRRDARSGLVIVTQYPRAVQFASVTHVSACLAGLPPVFVNAGHRIFAAG